MNVKINKLLLAIVAGAAIFLTGCQDQIIEPVADFKIMDVNVLNELDVNAIKVNEPLIFKNEGVADFISVWTGSKGAVYSENPEKMTYTEKERKYTGPDGEEMLYAAKTLDNPANVGRDVDVKSGQLTYTYVDAGSKGDTTYVVTWVATTVDEYGNSMLDVKSLNIRVIE
ncbi:MAG: hypothetical protein ACERKD_19990 [Prolixibacteraceae bacterium]